MIAYCRCRAVSVNHFEHIATVVVNPGKPTDVAGYFWLDMPIGAGGSARHSIRGLVRADNISMSSEPVSVQRSWDVKNTLRRAVLTPVNIEGRSQGFAVLMQTGPYPAA
jgi:hypothetical protein